MRVERPRESFASGAWARGLYWLVAKASAVWLASSGCVESAVARRSLGTGEILFARSDIDLALILKSRQDRGRALGRLYRLFSALKRLNPALGQVEVYREGEVEKFANRDTVWGEMERRTVTPLYGDSTPLTARPVETFHARRRFLLWFELLLPLVLSRGRIREMQKIALETWNFFALASGLIERPFIRRADMMTHLSVSQFRAWCGRLETAEEVKTFTLELARDFHSRHMEPLRRLSNPVSFTAVVPPFCGTRSFIVLPEPGTPLPTDSLTPGSFVVTPEYLDLYIQMRNGFCYQLLPEEVRTTGLKPPTLKSMSRDLVYNIAHQFLFHPGFSDPHTPHPQARVTCLELAVEALEAGQMPALPEQDELSRLAAWEGTLGDYYRVEYEDLSRRTDQIELRLQRLVGL